MTSAAPRPASSKKGAEKELARSPFAPRIAALRMLIDVSIACGCDRCMILVPEAWHRIAVLESVGQR